MIIEPSLLNANTYDIKNNLNEIKESGINYLHIDVMDGHFVPSQAFGPNTINDLKKNTDFILDVHLMIENPENYISDYRNADIITVHYEATRHLFRNIQMIKSLGIKVGVAINPATPICVINDILPLVDRILVITINPGVSNQLFIREMSRKISELVNRKEENNFHYDIEVDGNITNETIKECIVAGASIFVSGGYIFNGDSIKNRINSLIKAGEKYEH